MQKKIHEITDEDVAKYEMTDDEIEAAWEHAHAYGTTAGPISSFVDAVDFLKHAHPIEFEKAVKLLTIMAGADSISEEELQRAIKQLKRQKG